MDLLARLFGRPATERAAGINPRSEPAARAHTGSNNDQALERYRYMIRTAPPETVEQAHAEAFAKLTPEQRTQVLRELASSAPPSEQASLAGAQTDPQSLARLATRAEMRQPGTLERAFGGGGGGLGMGGMMAGTIFGSLVAGFVGSMVAQQFMDGMGDLGGAPAAESEMQGMGEDPGAVDTAATEADFDMGGDEF